MVPWVPRRERARRVPGHRRRPGPRHKVSDGGAERILCVARQLTWSEARYDCIEYCDEITQNVCSTETALNDTQHKWIDEMKCVLETLNQGVIINDHRSRVVFANRLFLKMIGMTSEELVGRLVAELYPPEDVPTLLKHIEQREAEGQGQYEFFVPRVGGEKLPVLITSRQIKDPDGNSFAVVTATDITEQKRAESELRQANVQLEQRHREIEEDLLLAARVQQSLAPSGLTWGKVLVETFYQPVRTIGGDFGLVAPRGDNPVSYTHLDVYKRQHRHRADIRSALTRSPGGRFEFERDARSDRRASRAGRGLHDHPRGRFAGVFAARAQSHYRNRQPGRRAAGAMDEFQQSPEFSLREFRRHLQNLSKT